MVIIFGMRGWKMLGETKQGGESVDEEMPRQSSLA